MEFISDKYPDFQIILRWYLPSYWSGVRNESLWLLRISIVPGYSSATVPDFHGLPCAWRRLQKSVL